MEVVQDMGMTDLQFKSWLKQIIRGLESAKEKGTKEETDKELDELLNNRKEVTLSGRIRSDEDRNSVLRNSISGSEGFTLTLLTRRSG